MRALEKEVNILNAKYCTRSKNHLVIRKFYSGCQVCLTGKSSDEGLGTRYFGITNGFSDPYITLLNLRDCEKYGWIKSVIKRYEKR